MKTDEISCNMSTGKMTHANGIYILSSGVYLVFGISIVKARNPIFESCIN